MNKILVLVEGQTEEAFVNQVLSPHLASRGVVLNPTIVATSKRHDGTRFKGGVPAYAKVRSDLVNLLNDTNAKRVTTMLDYYALRTDFPGMTDVNKGSSADGRVKHLEQAFAADLNDRRFVPYFSVHEIEAILFANVDAWSYVFNSDATVLERLKAACQGVATPEHINDGRETAPSKRIMRAFAGYQKVLHCPQAANAIGLTRIRNECAHFDQWVGLLEATA